MFKSKKSEKNNAEQTGTDKCSTPPPKTTVLIITDKYKFLKTGEGPDTRYSLQAKKINSLGESYYEDTSFDDRRIVLGYCTQDDSDLQIWDLLKHIDSLQQAHEKAVFHYPSYCPRLVY